MVCVGENLGYIHDQPRQLVHFFIAGMLLRNCLILCHSLKYVLMERKKKNLTAVCYGNLLNKEVQYLGEKWV